MMTVANKILLVGVIYIASSPTSTSFPTETTTHLTSIQEVTDSPDYDLAIEEITVNGDDIVFETSTVEAFSNTPTEEPTTRIPQVGVFLGEAQKEIFNELQSIWNYSEGLPDDQSQLKFSLSSLVHMTYARVYDQEDETLNRLKYLLKKLRARLLQEEDNTNAGFLPTTTISAEESPNAQPFQRRKRDVSEDVNAVDTAHSNENSLFPTMKDSASNINNDDNGHLKKPTSQHIIKNLLFLKNVPLRPLINGSTNSAPQDIKIVPNPGPTTASMVVSHKDQFYEPVDSSKEIVSINDIDDASTVDEVLKTIISVISSTNLTTSTSTTMNPQKIEILTTSSIESYESLRLKNFPKNDTKPYANASENITDPLPQEHISKLSHKTLQTNFSLSELQQLKPTELYIDNSSDTGIIDSIAANNDFDYFFPFGVDDQIDEEVMPTTAYNDSFLSAIVENLQTFVNAFQKLSRSAKIILTFVIVISLTSIGLGLLSMGPPVVILGVLSIILPTIVLLVLESNKSNRKNVKEDIKNELTLSSEDIDKILHVVINALQKYSQIQT